MARRRPDRRAAPRALLALAAALLAAGCAAPADALRPVTQPGALAGRSYYALDPAATCRANDPARTRIRTWRERIEFEADRVLIWGTLCNDAANAVSLAELAPALRASPSLDRIEYQGRVLTYAASRPALCPAGAWCPVEETPR